MPAYPSLAKNMGNTSPATRNDIYTGEDVFIMDRDQTSFVTLFNLGRDYALNKQDNNKFRDFFAGSIGTTILELMSGYSELNSYYAVTARRETYLFEAQLRDSGIAISSNLGYATYRGNNPILTLTVIPNMDINIKKFDIIGSFSGGDIVALEEKDFELGKEVDIQVILGVLKVTDLTIGDPRTYYFRFNNDKISEHIQIKLDGKIVPTSKNIYDLLNDNFVIMSNPVGGVDVIYLNRFQPQRWEAFAKYTFFDYALPTYDWRSLHVYRKGDIVNAIAAVDGLPIMYEAQNTGTSSRSEPVWNEEVDKITSDGIELNWKCIGRLKKQLYLKCISPSVNITGAEEPNWPITVGETRTDGNCQWIVTDTFDQSKYFYSTGSTMSLSYIELDDVKYNASDLGLDVGVVNSTSLESKYQGFETLKEMQFNAPLYNETRYVIRGREDYRKLFRMYTINCVDCNAFDPIPAVVDLSYVKDHTPHVWRPDKMITTGDEVLSTDGNNYIYRANVSGYCGYSRKGLSGVAEPKWIPDGYKVPPRKDGDRYPDIPRVTDYQVIWEARFIPLTGLKPDAWMARNQYELGNIIFTNTGYYFEAVEFNTEPIWPKKIGGIVNDNDISWTCVDTIFFEGYDADYWSQGKQVEEGDYVIPVTPTGYFYKCMKAGVTGETEPDWPTTICEFIDDNTALWQCYDRTDAQKYVKNRVQERISKNRPYGVSPAIIDDPTLIMVYLEFDIVTNDYMDDTTINNDLFDILNKHQRVLGEFIDTETLENNIEDIDYVKIARAKITGNTKTIAWEPGTMYRLKDIVYPKTSNGYVYVANRIQTGGYGYTQWHDRAYSMTEEPDWKDVQVFDRVNDGNLVWQIRYTAELGGIIPNYWEPDTVYSLDSCVLMPCRVKDLKYYAKVVDIRYTEPKWPTVPGKSILDGRVYWTCLDPTKSMACGWNEYMMFSWKLNATKYTKGRTFVDKRTDTTCM